MVDQNEARIAEWTLDNFPLCEPGLEKMVREARGGNLHFKTDHEGAISEAKIIFVCAGTPTKIYVVGGRRGAVLRYIESAGRMIVRVADGPQIIVEKSTTPVNTSEAMLKDLETDRSIR